MIYTQNKKSKKRNGQYSENLHTSKFRSATRTKTLAQKTMFCVIALSIVIVIIASILPFFFNTEKNTKAKIEELASDYYENYFYETLINSEKFQENEDLDSAMEKYKTYGFSIVTLRQLLLRKSQENTEYSNISQYCDENATFVRFYPESPYSKTSYHADYTYSCAF